MVEPLVIHDRYEVIRRLAIGGMGEIFLARQTGMAGFKRLVILKTLRPELSEQPEFLTQFLDEARLAAHLNHPNIVAIYEIGAWRGLHFIAMEYIGGIDLSVLLQKTAGAQARVPHRVAASIVMDAAVGLDYAHHARDDEGKPLGLVHRDVSPQNVMVRPDGIVKVVDFGVAQASSQLHQTGADRIKGKIRYMSPEQLSGEPLDGRSDQFSLGIVLWELVAGRPLFPQANPVDVFQRIVSGEIPPARLHAQDVPEALEAVVGRMLSRAVADRFPRMSDVAAALRAFLDQTGGQAHDEVSAFVTSVAGAFIADRVRDLTPRAVTIEDADDAAPALQQADATQVHEDLDELTRAATVSMVPRSGDDHRPEPSEVLLSAVEHSGVLHGDRRRTTLLVGKLTGWGALQSQIANVPMGSFALNRLKNLLVRQVASLAATHGGEVVTNGPDRFVLVFGAKKPRPDDAARALRCALGVRELVVDLGRDPRQRVTVHMGVAAGQCMVVGEEGEPVQVAGVAVESAERLAGVAHREGRALATTRALLRLCGDAFVARPLSKADDDAGAYEVEGERVAASSGSTRRVRRILIADDADVFRRIEEEILRPYHFAFLHARDGAQAVKLALEHKPDLILLDVQMPVMDGVQVLSFLRKTPETKDIPVVVITTIGRAHDEDLLLRGGASAFLTKPVQPPLLVATVQRLLKVDA